LVAQGRRPLSEGSQYHSSGSGSPPLSWCRRPSSTGWPAPRDRGRSASPPQRRAGRSPRAGAGPRALSGRRAARWSADSTARAASSMVRTPMRRARRLDLAHPARFAVPLCAARIQLEDWLTTRAEVP
jgi:hypothetical protein